MLQAPMFDGLSLDPFALADDGIGSSKVGVGGRHIVQALMIALVIVVLDERLDLAFEIAGQEVVFEQDPVLQGLVPALDLALGLGMEGCAAFAQGQQRAGVADDVHVSGVSGDGPQGAHASHPPMGLVVPNPL